MQAGLGTIVRKFGPAISRRSDLRKMFTDGQTERCAIALAHGMS